MPSDGQKIKGNADMSLSVPDRPIIPFMDGDGTGVDITPVMLKVVDAAVAKAYGGKRQIQWMEVYAGEKAARVYGPDIWLPEETVQALRDYAVSIKGPLTTPVGGGIRSLNVALRQALDLYVCLRPVQYFKGVPSPLKEPEKTNMVIFRENSEDIYAGIEFEAKSDQAKKLMDFLVREMGIQKIRFPDTSAIGVKPVSIEGTERLIRKAWQYAVDYGKILGLRSDGAGGEALEGIVKDTKRLVGGLYDGISHKAILESIEKEDSSLATVSQIMGNSPDASSVMDQVVALTPGQLFAEIKRINVDDVVSEFVARQPEGASEVVCNL